MYTEIKQIFIINDTSHVLDHIKIHLPSFQKGLFLSLMPGEFGNYLQFSINLI